MKRQQAIALLLALAMIATISAFASQGTESALPDEAQTTEAAEGEASEAALTAEDAAATEETALEEEAAAPTPDAEGTLSFGNLAGRIRENNYTFLALDRQVEEIDKTDLDDLRQDLVDGLNEIANQQWGMITSIPMLGSMAAGMMQSSYDALRQRLDDLKEGKTARDLENARRQLTAAEDQIIMLMESAYINLKGLEAQDAALTRGLATLERGAQTAKVSYEHGLVPQLTLEQLNAQRTQLKSGQATLRMGMDVLKLQLKAMVGVELDAPLELSALPKVTSEQLDAMDLEADLARAQEASADLFNAKATLEDARKTYKDSSQKQSDQRTWDAAQYTYKASEQSFELAFRVLYAQVKDAAQKAEAAKSALAMEERNYQVTALKYKQEAISQNALADAKDALAEAKDNVASAQRDLFSMYRSYYWAVEHGILNG